MAVAHILTKNNSSTIKKTLESVSFAEQILVADLGSSDGTDSICESLGATVIRLDRPRHEARNVLVLEGSQEWNFMIEPWEILIQGHKAIEKCEGTSRYASVITDKQVSKEIRFWKGTNHQFKNPIFEHLTSNCHEEINTTFYSFGRPYLDEVLDIVIKWKNDKPTAIAPWYYHACILLSQGKWENFLPVSEHYMVLDTTKSISSIMNRYYYAMANLIHKKKIRPTLQNLSICLSEKPLMAEFWCLMGDAFYHLAKDFKRAQSFYEDAIKLGSKRLKTDLWPMDITKYKSYPEKMIDSCNKITKSSSFYIKKSPQDD